MYHRSSILFVVSVALALLVCACGPAQPKPKNEEAVQQGPSAEEMAEEAIGQGGLALAEGDNETALAYYLEAARLLDSTGKVSVERADAHYEAAGVAYIQLDRELAIEEYDKAVQIYVRFSGNAKAKAAVALTNMGVIYKETSQKSKARACWDKALEIYNSLPAEFQSQRNIARIQQNIRDMEQGLY